MRRLSSLPFNSSLPFMGGWIVVSISLFISFKHEDVLLLEYSIKFVAFRCACGIEITIVVCLRS